MRLLDSSGGRGRLASCLGGELLARGLASGRLAGCLLGASHGCFFAFAALQHASDASAVITVVLQYFCLFICALTKHLNKTSVFANRRRRQDTISANHRQEHCAVKSNMHRRYMYPAFLAILQTKTGKAASCTYTI